MSTLAVHATGPDFAAPEGALNRAGTRQAGQEHGVAHAEFFQSDECLHRFAQRAGFTKQSHMALHFKRVLGVTLWRFAGAGRL